MEHPAGVGDKRAHLFGRCRIFLVHLFRIQRIGAKQGVGDGVLLAASRLDVLAKQRRVEQVDDAQSAARHLVFISRADAAAGGADAFASGSAFGGQFDHAG